jgi:iron complex outermembrane receptor protein
VVLGVCRVAASSAFIFASAAYAQPYRIDVPAGPIAESIRFLSSQTAVSIGYAGDLPKIYTRPVSGASSAADALRQMLSGTELRAIAVGPSAFRIVEHQLPKIPQRTQPSVSPPLPEEEIVVTALKRPEPLSTLPATDHVLTGDRLRAASGVPGTDELAREVPSLSVSSLGPGRNRLFLRGIGDGPLNGFNQGSVAVLLDEARLNYDAPDPDWALVDIHQVEILEGPQGPLYGTGALGGIVKISTNRPDFSRLSGAIEGGLSLSEEGDLSNSESATLNLPLSAKTGIRAVGYMQNQAGWIDNAGGTSDSNRQRLAGGRLGFRWAPTERWSIDLAGALQNRRARDSQYVDGDLGPLKRPNRLLEPRDLDARLAMLTVKGRLGSVELTSITSYSRQEAGASYDATPLASVLGTSGPTLVNDDRNYSLLDQEIRVGNSGRARLSWLAGVSFIDATTHASIVANDSSRAVPLLTLDRSITEAALFVDASYAPFPKLTIGAGARIFSTKVDDDGIAANTQRARGLHRIRGAGDLMLTWTPASHVTVYLRGATAYRPGGTNVELDAAQPVYEPDELAGFELGSRLRLSDKLSFAATLFAARWQHVQADQLLANGLVATANVGSGRDLGVESDLRFSVAPDFTLTGVLLAQSAQLDATPTTTGIEDRRLPAVPRLAARLQLERRFELMKWSGRASLGLRYFGATHLSFNPVLDRRTPPHATADASVELTRGFWMASLVGENLTGSSADTFGFGNPYRVRAKPQRTPTKPRTIGLSLAHRF